MKGEYVDENLQQLNLSDYLEQKSSDSDSVDSNHSQYKQNAYVLNDPSLIMELVAEHCRQKMIEYRAEPNGRKLTAYIPMNEP